MIEKVAYKNELENDKQREEHKDDNVSNFRSNYILVTIFRQFIFFAFSYALIVHFVGKKKMQIINYLYGLLTPTYYGLQYNKTNCKG